MQDLKKVFDRCFNKKTLKEQIVELIDTTPHPDDITANRHGGNKFSNDAFIKTLKVKSRNQTLIIEFIKEFGPSGAREIVEYYKKWPEFSHLEMNQIGPRMTELKALNVLIPTSEKRFGCQVFKLNEEIVWT